MADRDPFIYFAFGLAVAVFVWWFLMGRRTLLLVPLLLLLSASVAFAQDEQISTETGGGSIAFQINGTSILINPSNSTSTATWRTMFGDKNPVWQKIPVADGASGRPEMSSLYYIKAKAPLLFDDGTTQYAFTSFDFAPLSAGSSYSSPVETLHVLVFADSALQRTRCFYKIKPYGSVPITETFEWEELYPKATTASGANSFGMISNGAGGYMNAPFLGSDTVLSDGTIGNQTYISYTGPMAYRPSTTQPSTQPTTGPSSSESQPAERSFDWVAQSGKHLFGDGDGHDGLLKRLQDSPPSMPAGASDAFSMFQSLLSTATVSSNPVTDVYTVTGYFNDTSFGMMEGSSGAVESAKFIYNDMAAAAGENNILVVLMNKLSVVRTTYPNFFSWVQVICTGLICWNVFLSIVNLGFWAFSIDAGQVLSMLTIQSVRDWWSEDSVEEVDPDSVDNGTFDEGAAIDNQNSHALAARRGRNASYAGHIQVGE